MTAEENTNVKLVAAFLDESLGSFRALAGPVLGLYAVVILKAPAAAAADRIVPFLLTAAFVIGLALEPVLLTRPPKWAQVGTLLLGLCAGAAPAALLMTSAGAVWFLQPFAFWISLCGSTAFGAGFYVVFRRKH